MLRALMMMLAALISAVHAHAQETELFTDLTPDSVAGQQSATASPTSNELLRLFEPIEASASAADSPAPAPDTTSRSGGPQFTLVGTSQFGSKRQVRLRLQNGETLVVPLPDESSGSMDARAEIPGYPGHFVDEVANRQLIIQHPAGNSCYADPDEGVTCVGSNVSRLQLATAAPIATQAPAQSAEESSEDRGGRRDRRSEDSAEEQPENPFAAALRAARERSDPDAAVRRTEESRFRPRRIDPADVPEGARLVRTPFGDRIVPAEPNSQ